MGAHRDLETWRALVEEWKSSGQTLRAFCEGKSITRSGLSRWAHRLGYGRMRPLAARKVPPADGSGCSLATCDPATTSPHALVVHVPGGFILRFRVEPAPEYVQALVVALAGDRFEAKAGFRATESP